MEILCFTRLADKCRLALMRQASRHCGNVMTAFVSDLVQEKGTAAALVWAGLAALYIHLKDRAILKKLEASIVASSGIVWRRFKEHQCKGVTLHNRTKWPITIREVGVTTSGKSSSFRFAYIGDRELDEYGHVTLKADMSDCWGAPINDETSARITGGWVVIEHSSLLGATTVRRLILNPKQAEMLQTWFNEPPVHNAARLEVSPKPSS